MVGCCLTANSSTIVSNRWHQKPFEQLQAGPHTWNTYQEKFKYRNRTVLNRHLRSTRYKACCFLGVTIPSTSTRLSLKDATSTSVDDPTIYVVDDGLTAHLYRPGEASHFLVSDIVQRLGLMDLDPATAKLGIAILGPFLSAFAFLFIIRIVMSWYPKLPVGEFPYVLAYAPTEPILILTRKLIPPLGGVDVTPVVWFGLVSFLNEILVGPQGLLVLLSQQGMESAVEQQQQ